MAAKKECIYNSSKPYIIAETAYSHQGNINYLFRLIDGISEVGVSAVKFHLLLDPGNYMVKGHPLFFKLKNWIFDKKTWKRIINYSARKNLEVIALCDDRESIDFINSSTMNVRAIELHAAGINDYFLLDAVSKFKKSVMLGVGGCTFEEIEFAVDSLRQKGKKEIILMYGFQSYPTNYRCLNLSKIVKLREAFKLPVGYADHTSSDNPYNELISSSIAMMGINILEKHFTLSPGEKRIDSESAVGREKFLAIKSNMQVLLSAFGSPNLRMSRQELEYGALGLMKKAIVAARVIKKGEMLTLNNLVFKRTVKSSKLSQRKLRELLNKYAKKTIQKDEIVDLSKVNNSP